METHGASLTRGYSTGRAGDLGSRHAGDGTHVASVHVVVEEIGGGL